MTYPKKLSLKRVRTNCTVQYDATECGAASLSIILKYFGRFEKIKELRDICGVDRSGTTAFKLVKAGESYGLNSRPYQCSADELKRKGRFPCIAYWGFDHYLVIEGFKSERVYLSDPDKGRHSIEFKEFCDYFTGVILEFEPGPKFTEKGKKEQPILSLLPLFRPFIGSILVLITVSSLVAIPTIFVAGLSAQFVDSFLQEQRYYFGIPIIWLSLLAITMVVTFDHLQYMVLRRLELVFSKRITVELFYRLFSSPLSFYQQRLQGELASRMLIGLQMTQLVVQQGIREICAIWSSLLLLLLALVISKWLTLLAVIALASNVAFNIWLTEYRKDDNQKYAIEEGKAAGLTLQGINNIETIKSSGSEFDFLDTWQTSFDEVQAQFQKIGSQLGLSSVASSTSTYLLNAFTLIIGGFLIILGQLSLGELTAFQFIQGQIIAPISIVPSLTQSIQSLQGLIGRIQDLLSVEPDPLARGLDFLDGEYGVRRSLGNLDSKEANTKEAIKGALVCRDLGFRYSDKVPPTFESLELDIKEGMRVAIVGRSGCGKSTLIKLLAGLATPTGGKIFLDGREYLQYQNKDLREAIAYVPQDVFCFNASVLENITCWEPGYSREEVVAAAKKARLHETIISHPEGYNRILRDNGADLSGGQRQRLEIARALLRNPKIVLLDEATCFLDNETEKNVLSSIWENCSTVVMVAHRLTAALNSDHIVVIDGGSIKEQGSPKELLAAGGLFKELYDREFST